MLTALPFVGPFCRTVCAQSTTQPWHANHLAPHKVVIGLLIRPYKSEMLYKCGLICNPHNEQGLLQRLIESQWKRTLLLSCTRAHRSNASANYAKPLRSLKNLGSGNVKWNRSKDVTGQIKCFQIKVKQLDKTISRHNQYPSQEKRAEDFNKKKGKDLQFYK